jgi:tetratricopeptide (TPR) repeat protein
VVVSSVVSAKNSVVGVTRLEAVVERSAKLGDYQLARGLWNESMGELEDVVYPERKIERRIADLEIKLGEYPGNRQIYLALAELYAQLDNAERAAEYREKARILDPNN